MFEVRARARRRRRVVHRASARCTPACAKLMISMVTYSEMGMKLQYRMKNVTHMPHAGYWSLARQLAARNSGGGALASFSALDSHRYQSALLVAARPHEVARSTRS